MSAAEKINAEVINLSTIKPLDEETILSSVKKTGKVITLEEHSTIGGMGSMVAKFLGEKFPLPIKIMGIPDVFGESARDYQELLDKYGVRDRCYFNLNAMVMGIYMREDLHDTASLLSLNAQGDSPELQDLCNTYDLAYLCIPIKYLNEDYITRIHAYREEKPVFVQCYPVSDEPGWRRMIDMGVDVIQTDFPEALIEYLNDNNA